MVLEVVPVVHGKPGGPGGGAWKVKEKEVKQNLLVHEMVCLQD